MTQSPTVFVVELVNDDGSGSQFMAVCDSVAAVEKYAGQDWTDARRDSVNEQCFVLYNGMGEETGFNLVYFEVPLHTD